MLIKDNKDKKEKNIFNKIETIDGRKIYHTKIFKHLISFKVTNKRQRLRLTFQKFNDIGGWYFFNLFSLKEGDEFLGIRYGWDKLDKTFFLREVNNKAFVIKKLYYLEFVFKGGSIKCYIQSLRTLLRKEKENTEYYKFNLTHIKNMENIVYSFYDKKLPEGGLISKWTAKRQK